MHTHSIIKCLFFPFYIIGKLQVCAIDIIEGIDFVISFNSNEDQQTFCAMCNREYHDNVSLKGTDIIINSDMIFENEKLNKMRIWLYNADEPHIENKILHSFNRSSEKYAIDAFMNDLDMNYNFPLNGYITSPSIKTNEPSTPEINNDDCCYIRYRE